jgi:metallo-beta-lactamase family protein
MDIQFAGAAKTVTGSKYLVTAGSKRILLDCGLFQGLKELRLRNWDSPPFDPRQVDVVLLTHAHIDHSGYLPLLVKRGFSGHVLCTDATRDLAAVLLRDSAHLAEEEAGYANRHGYSKHSPALPLYTTEDAERALGQFLAVDAGQAIELGGGARCRFLPAGHILGAAMVLLEHEGTSILFTGDLGRLDDPVMRPPTTVPRADYLVLESTYGDREHDAIDTKHILAVIVRSTYERGGVIVVPAFCVGRAQLLLHLMAELRAANEIPDLPIYLNSPMATDTTELYCRYPAYHRLGRDACGDMCRVAHVVRSVEESKRLNARAEPMMIIAGSGMATGGRVLHHLEAFAPDPKNTILFAGYQAAGTRGASIIGGATAVKIHGHQVPIRSKVFNLSGLSAHADRTEILKWLHGFDRPPQHTFLTHGEPEAARSLGERIRTDLGWTCSVPDHLELAHLAQGVVRAAPSTAASTDGGGGADCCGPELETTR